MIEAVFSLTVAFDILIVDDGSPDGTARLVKEQMKKFSGRLFIEERSGKLGLGTAYIHGFRWALQKGYEYIFEMDADFSHNPRDLPRLYEACAKQGADVAVGSRYVKGGKVENWPASRILLSYFASLYVRLITWIPCKDTTAGFICYRRKVLENIDLGSIRFVGYAFQIEMKFKAWKKGFRLKEVPITFINRVAGDSKMSRSIAKEASKGVLQMQWESMFGGSK